MTFSMLWTVLPAGLDPSAGTARLSMVASPRIVKPGTTTLGASDLRRWPELVASLRGLRIVDADSGATFPARVLSAPPDQSLWETLLPDKTPVDVWDESDTPIFRPVVESYSYQQAHTTLSGIYAGDTGEALSADHPLASLDAKRTTAAALAPLDAVLGRLQVSDNAIGGNGIAKKVRSVEHAEFHQVVGQLLDHPALALKLGLRVDLEVRGLTGTRTIFVEDADGRMRGPVSIPQPRSRVIAENGRFVMASQGGEIVEGMLDLRPGIGDVDHVISQLDVPGLTAQLGNVGAALAAGATATLPPRRDVGITVAQIGRRAGVVENTLTAGAIWDAAAGAPVLFADDVTAGYRVDISTNGGPFRSLMKRVIAYGFGGVKGALEVHDEGQVDPIAVVEQKDSSGDPLLVVGEELFAWNGWSLVTPMPGGRVGADDVPGGQVETGLPGPVPGFPLTLRVRAEGGTLPRLRYGNEYQMRVRASDLAGNSIDPALCDPAMVSEKIRYTRKEVVTAPVALPRKPFGAGEHLLKLVIRTNDGVPVGLPTCERQLAPPKASQRVVELHGLFDSAFGPDTPARAAERKRLLAIAKRESRSWSDPAPGIGVAGKTQLPLPPGEALPPGEYVFFDADHLPVPYLPEPISNGAALRLTLPGHTLPSRATGVYGTKPWPDASTVRLMLNAGTAAAINGGSDSIGRGRISVMLPPATEIEGELSSMITVAGLAVLDGAPKGQNPIAAREGQDRRLSPAVAVRFVHAVQRPVSAPQLTFAAPPERTRGATWARLRGTVACHAASTAKVDVEASWDEVVDHGTGPIETATRRAVATSHDVPGNALSFDVRQQFGDTDRRRITFSAVGATRFREYFPGGDDADFRRAGAGVVVDVPNARRPTPPVVDCVLPTFRWTRTLNANHQSERRTVGVRVWLRRKWHETGFGERLGVLVFSDNAAAEAAAGHEINDVVTRFGSDPLEAQMGPKLPLVPSYFPVGRERLDSVTLPELAGASAGVTVSVVGHEVKFDPERDMWYADIDVDNVVQPFPFLQLGLVRYQPVSVGGCHISSVVVPDLIQLPPRRTLIARVKAPGRVQVSLFGDRIRNSFATFSHERRLTGAQDISTRLPADPFAQVNPTFSSADSMTYSAELVTNAQGDSLAELLAGRIVVQEHQRGWSVLRSERISRPIYVETVDRAVLDIPGQITPPPLPSEEQ